jgi:hypothetical protein
MGSNLTLVSLSIRVVNWSPGSTFGSLNLGPPHTGSSLKVEIPTVENAQRQQGAVLSIIEGNSGILGTIGLCLGRGFGWRRFACDNTR